jgi:hypothetical protein
VATVEHMECEWITSVAEAVRDPNGVLEKKDLVARTMRNENGRPLVRPTWKREAGGEGDSGEAVAWTDAQCIRRTVRDTAHRNSCRAVVFPYKFHHTIDEPQIRPEGSLLQDVPSLAQRIRCRYDDAVLARLRAHTVSIASRPFPLKPWKSSMSGDPCLAEFGMYTMPSRPPSSRPNGSYRSSMTTFDQFGRLPARVAKEAF